MNIQQACVWIRRIAHSRGFGIQSPTDYRFAVDVIGEHWPYYAYSEVGRGDSSLRRKKGRLLLRIANHMQPAVIIDRLGYAEYLKAGCRKAKMATTLPGDNRQPVMLLTPPAPDAADTIAHCPQQSIVIVDDIGHNKHFWHNIADSATVTVAFDLYYLGIAFIDEQRSKQHYIINF